MSTDNRKTHRNFSPEKKAAIVRRHLQDHVAVSDLCDEYNIHPSLFYRWQKQVFDNLTGAFEEKRGKRSVKNRESSLEHQIHTLKAKLAKKDTVIAEVSEEFVRLKKELGEL